MSDEMKIEENKVNDFKISDTVIMQLPWKKPMLMSFEDFINGKLP